MPGSPPLPPTRAWDAATADLPAPLAVVDLDAFDANAADLVRRAGGLPIRVASKSVRCRTLLDRALATPGFAGVMAYAAREAVWLARPSADGRHPGCADVFVAYPTVDAREVRQIATGDDGAGGLLAERVTLTVDSAEHVRWLVATLAGVHAAAPLQVAIDVDASLRVGRGRLTAHLGVRRSPLRTPDQAAEVTRLAAGAGLRVVGVMFYDAQVAGLPDTSPAVRLVKHLSHRDLRSRRAQVVAAVRHALPPGEQLRFVNGGGTGSLDTTGRDAVLTELAAGSGLYAPTLFDGYRTFRARPAAAYALPVVRRPGPGMVTVFSGGYSASGAAGRSRLPSLVDPRLHLLGAEGAGEVQTPVAGPGADDLALGERVWLRHAKAGEAFERFDEVHLVRGAERVATVPTYRGEGANFG